MTSPVDTTLLNGPRPLVLREWVPWSGDLSLAEASALARQAGAALDVDIDRQGRICVRPKGFVGRLRTDDFDIHISPKVPVETVLALLAEAFDLAQFGQHVKYGEHASVEDFIVRALVADVETLLRRGLHRVYREHDADLSAMRGRVLVRQTTDHFLNARPMVACRFDEFTADCVENRVLLAALDRVAMSACIQTRHRLAARQVSAVFAEVGTDAIVDIDIDAVASLGRDVRTRHYRQALGLAELVLRSMGFHERHGAWRSSGFLVDMAKLFERLLTARLRRSMLPLGYDVQSQLETTLDVDGHVKIIPDIVVRSPQGKGVIVDAKYKDESTPSQADMYQMVAYCRALGIHDAVLVNVAGGSRRTFVVRDGVVAIHVMHVDLESMATFGASVSETADRLIALMRR
jgi:5-methylcytosine-specific restriction enzyme subunit McrC